MHVYVLLPNTHTLAHLISGVVHLEREHAQPGQRFGLGSLDGVDCGLARARMQHNASRLHIHNRHGLGAHAQKHRQLREEVVRIEAREVSVDREDDVEVCKEEGKWGGFAGAADCYQVDRERTPSKTQARAARAGAARGNTDKGGEVYTRAPTLFRFPLSTRVFHARFLVCLHAHTLGFAVVEPKEKADAHAQTHQQENGGHENPNPALLLPVLRRPLAVEAAPGLQQRWQYAHVTTIACVRIP